MTVGVFAILGCLAVLADVHFVRSTSDSDVSYMKMFGIGLTVAVLVDATLVRTLLLPALMRVLGRTNWWPNAVGHVHRRAAPREAEHVNEALSTQVGPTT